MYIRKSLFANPQLGNIGNWQQRHNEAVTSPRGMERPIVRMLEAWGSYAEAFDKRYEQSIGEDYFLGPHWASVGVAVRGLLNGESGNLDCGTLDAYILNTLSEAGFDENGEFVKEVVK